MPCRRWTQHEFARLGDLLIERYGVKVIVTSALEERDYVEAIRSMMHTPTQVFSNLSLQEFAALCTRATVIVSNDSGAKHIAVAVGATVVTIFGPTDEEVWNPPDRERYPAIRVEIPCARCGLKRDCPNGMRCMEEVDVERVMKEVLLFISAKI
jgi:ADP-heptose:LPS heptosyltransferase